MQKPDKPLADIRETNELLKDLLITQLAIAGLSIDSIRKVARCGQNRVAEIVKHMKSARKD